LLPGHAWVAFDLTAHVDPGSWWVSIITGITDLSPAAATAVTVTRGACAGDWAPAAAGTQTFTVANQSGMAGEITLVNAAGAIAGEIETLGPGTSAPLTATLGTGTGTFQCRLGSQPVTSSQPVQVTAGGATADPVAVKPVTRAELTGPNKRYRAYAAGQLADLAGAAARIQADLRGGAAFAQTYADVQVTRAVLGYLAPLIAARQPGLVATAGSQLDTLQRALLTTQVNGNWQSPATAPLSARENADSAIGVLLESLASVPDLLEIPPTH